VRLPHWRAFALGYLVSAFARGGGIVSALARSALAVAALCGYVVAESDAGLRARGRFACLRVPAGQRQHIGFITKGVTFMKIKRRIASVLALLAGASVVAFIASGDELPPPKATPSTQTNKVGVSSGPSTAEDGKITIDIVVNWPKNRPAIVAPLQFADSLPAVACKINGREALFLVDTGAGPVCLFQDHLKKYGIRNLGVSDVVTVSAAGRSDNSSWTGPFTLSIQDVLPVKISSATCVPASARTDKQDFDGILSASLMKALNCVIDLKEDKITFFRDKSSKPPGKETQPTKPNKANASGGE
jgi:hypothetical protein